jgi:hypothetical protein
MVLLVGRMAGLRRWKHFAWEEEKRRRWRQSRKKSRAQAPTLDPMSLGGLARQDNTSVLRTSNLLTATLTRG